MAIYGRFRGHRSCITRGDVQGGELYFGTPRYNSVDGNFRCGVWMVGNKPALFF